MILLLDTHVLIWLTEGNSRLGADSIELINQAQTAGKLAVAAISFWETAMLVEKKRLRMHVELQAWRRELLNFGLQEIGMHGQIAIEAGQLHGFHGDPADRMIVATALNTPASASLMTADKKILCWPGLQEKQDARR